MLNLAFLRRHNKKILAFFGVFLMIAFILPSSSKRPGTGRTEFGKAYGQAISATEFNNAQGELKILRQRLALTQDIGYMEISLAQRLFGFSGYEPLNDRFIMQLLQNQMELIRAREIAERIDPISFTLLLREAHRMNVQASADQVQEVLKRFQRKNEEPTADDQFWQTRALTDWLTILAAFDRVAEVSRISPAMATWIAASSSERASLELIDFRAVDFEKAAGKPSEDQLTAFFKQYANQDRETSENGIGYRFPNRVRLQYIKIIKAKAIESVTKDEAADYWYNHQQEFVRVPKEPTKQPTTQATTQSATQPSSKPATRTASTQPTTQPWVEGNDIDEEIRGILAEQRMAAMAKAIHTRISAEWPAFLEQVRAEKKPIPDKAPNTEYGVPYQTFSFLRQVSEKVQTFKDSHNVLPETHELDRLYSATELKQETDVGKAIGLPQYLMRYVEPFMTEKERKQTRNPALRVLEPLRQPARDEAGNLYIVRVLEADPARPARDLDEVRVQVGKDWLRVESMKKAKEAAEKFLVPAKAKGVPAAAKEQGLEGKVVQTDLFRNEPSEKIGKYELPRENPDDKDDRAEAASRARLIQGAFDLLQKQIRTGEPHPVGLIELPRAGRVVIAQLLEAKPAESGLGMEWQTIQMQMQYARMRTAALVGDWFDPESFHKRTKYEGDSRTRHNTTSDED
ncbi:MAG: hypothetical protein ACHRHE_19315 [Tepidisphaerales bacterium]